MAKNSQIITGSRIVANPRYKTNPTTSVNVVTATAEARAGSIRKAFRIRGSDAPLRLATIKFPSIAIPTTAPIYSLPCQ